MDTNQAKKKPITPEEAEKAHQEKLKKREASYLNVRYRINRKLAIQEERMDYHGEENVLIDGRNAFFETLKKLFNLGKKISDRDLSIIKNSFYTHPEFINKEKIKFVLDVVNKEGGLTQLDETVNEFLSLLRDTEYYKSMYELKKWVNLKKVSLRINELRKNGASSQQIAERLNISTAEVKVFSEKARELPALFDDKTR